VDKVGDFVARLLLTAAVGAILASASFTILDYFEQAIPCRSADYRFAGSSDLACRWQTSGQRE
jgi:hypothetical protein